MANPLFQQLAGQQQGPAFLNPVQKVNYILSAIANPAQFVKQQFPDIPDQIMNDPQQILSYLQRTRGISTPQLQSLMEQYHG